MSPNNPKRSTLPLSPRRNRKQDNRDRKRRASHDTDAEHTPPPPPRKEAPWARELRQRLEEHDQWRPTSEP